MQFYHGTYSRSLRYSSTGGKSDDGDMLFASADIGVANRYGKYVFSVRSKLVIDELPKISVNDWMWGKPLPAGTFVIDAEEGNDDFPVPTLVIRNANDAEIHPNPVMIADVPFYF